MKCRDFYVHLATLLLTKKRKMRYSILLLLVLTFSFTACDTTPDNANEAKLIIKFKLDSTQARLDAFGQPVSVPSGNAAQHPQFNGLSAHKIELVPNALTAVNAGPIIYHGSETTTGGNNAINFDEAIIKNDGEIFLEVPLKDITTGSYEYIRVSVSYQNFDVYYNIINIPFNSSTIDLNNQTGTLASFVGFNTYIGNLTPKNVTEVINLNQLQGYWAFETILSSPYESFNDVYTGQAAGTTVVNPISSSTPTPAGSCLVTGTFGSTPLEITGSETDDITLTLSFSTNNSFEWTDSNGNGELDINADTSSATLETVIDMGLRGLNASFQ